MRRFLNILDFADSHPSPCAVFSLDAEKAFDRLEWNYMWAVLQCFGFGEHLISMIKTLYYCKNPPASPNSGIQRPGQRFNACSGFYLRYQDLVPILV